MTLYGGSRGVCAVLALLAGLFSSSGYAVSASAASTPDADYADLPGADEGSVHVRFEDGVLALDAQLSTLPDPGWTPVRREYRLGSYHREFRLSEDVDVARVSATMKSGVLELRLPKTAESRPRTIPVQAA